MTEAVAASVTQSEEEAFWRTHMPSGVASTAKDASMETGQDGGSTAATETTQAHKEDDRGGKWARDQGHRGKGRNSGRGGDTYGQYDGHSKRKGQWCGDGDGQSQEKVISDLKRQIRALQRCALRHEDSIQVLRQEVSFVVFMRTGVDASIVKPLAEARAAWTRQKEQDPQSLNKPIGSTMFACWMNELLARAVGLLSKPEAVKKMAELKWMNQEGNYLRWDQESKTLMEDASRTPVTTAQATEILQDVLKCSMDSTAITRFFPTRPLAPELKGEAITMMLQFAFKGDAPDRLVQHMHTLSGLAVTQLCACQLRPERAQRSGLAVAISKELPR